MAFTNDKFRIDGKVAIVTGAGARGNSIGRAYALGLANAGASVVVADLNGEGAKKVVDEIKAAGGKATAVQVDITDRASVANMVETAKKTYGGVDILVNNAALMVEIAGSKPTCQISTEDFNQAMSVNLNGALHCSQAVVPIMVARGGGRIVNQLSAGAFPAQGVYGITKLALLGLTTALAIELGKQKITVNAIAPGMVKTDAGTSLGNEETPWVQFVSAGIPLHPRSEPDALVGALLLLVSEAGEWMTGQTLNVDGGWKMRN